MSYLSCCGLLNEHFQPRLYLNHTTDANITCTVCIKLSTLSRLSLYSRKYSKVWRKSAELLYSVPYSRKIWWFSVRVANLKTHQCFTVVAHVWLYLYVVHVHELSLVVRTVGRSLPKFELPNIFPWTDSPNFPAIRYCKSVGIVISVCSLWLLLYLSYYSFMCLCSTTANIRNYRSHTTILSSCCFVN